MSGIALGPYASTVGFDDGARYRQAHAHAALLGGKEWLEYLLQLSRLNAWTGILHIDDGRAVTILQGSGGDLAPSLYLGCHGVQGIREQVEHHLLKLNRVTAHP